MNFERTTGIDTPEGVRLELTLAGLGSRTGAQLVDWLIRLAVWLLLSIGLGWSGGLESFVAFQVVFASVALLAYELVFEAIWSGRTPGKAAFGIRVVNVDGSPARFAAIVVRNLLRLVDLLPGTYGVAFVSIFVTKRHQRLGDMAAGTIVIRERKGSDRGERFHQFHSVPIPAGFDATAVSAEDVALIRQFLDRRATLDDGPARRLAAQMAGPLRAKVFQPAGSLDDMALLRTIVAFKDR
jgi:uncharacterized RDD family membrane protein YckC